MESFQPTTAGLLCTLLHLPLHFLPFLTPFYEQKKSEGPSLSSLALIFFGHYLFRHPWWLTWAI